MDFRIPYHHIPAILERVISVQAEAVNIYILPVHEQVIPMLRLNAAKLRIPAVPAAFQGIRQNDVLQNHPVHITEHLGRFHAGILHVQIPGIPDGGPGAFPEQAMFHQQPVIVPERVLPPELAPYGFNVGTFLQGGFPRINNDVFQPKMAGSEQGAFPFVGSIFNHSLGHGDDLIKSLLFFISAPPYTKFPRKIIFKATDNKNTKRDG